MKVILKEDSGKLGKSGDIVEVKDGYARNCLFPGKLAFPATENNIKSVEAIKERRERAIEKEKKAIEALAERLSRVSCTILVSTGPDEKLYGSVTNADIARALKDEGLDIDKKSIDIKDPITRLGIYQVDIKLHPEITTQIRIWIVKE